MMRLFSNILIFLSIFFLPVIVTILLIVLGIFLFDNFVESLFWAYCIDVFYGSGMLFGVSFGYTTLLFMAVFFLASFPLKKILKFYSYAQ